MIYAYIFVMAGVTYLIRMLPLTLIQKKITNVYLKSFLYYIPYACLTAMTFPGYFVCNRICDFCNGRISCSNTSGTQEKKPGDSGTVFLYRGICDREAVGNDLISYIKWCKLIKIQKSRQTMEVYFVSIYRKF